MDEKEKLYKATRRFLNILTILLTLMLTAFIIGMISAIGEKYEKAYMWDSLQKEISSQKD